MSSGSIAWRPSARLKLPRTMNKNGTELGVRHNVHAQSARPRANCVPFLPTSVDITVERPRFGALCRRCGRLDLHNPPDRE